MTPFQHLQACQLKPPLSRRVCHLDKVPIRYIHWVFCPEAEDSMSVTYPRFDIAWLPSQAPRALRRSSQTTSQPVCLKMQPPSQTFCGRLVVEAELQKIDMLTSYLWILPIRCQYSWKLLESFRSSLASPSKRNHVAWGFTPAFPIFPFEWARCRRPASTLVSVEFSILDIASR